MVHNTIQWLNCVMHSLNMEIKWKLVEKSHAQFWSALKWKNVYKKWTSWAGTSFMYCNDDRDASLSSSYVNMILYWCIIQGTQWLRIVPAQDGPFFYTRSHLSALQNCALLFSTNFKFIFIFIRCITQFSHWIVSCTIFFSKILHSYLLNSRTVL